MPQPENPPPLLPHWQLRLLYTLHPYLPSGKLALWAPDDAMPQMKLPCPPECLLERYDLAAAAKPTGTAWDGALVLCGAAPCLPWPEFLNDIGNLLTREAPLLLLLPRGGLVALHQPGWVATLTPKEALHHLRHAGYRLQHSTLIGGASWPSPALTAACRLLVAVRHGSGPSRVQFNRNGSGTAPSTALPGAAFREG